MESNTNQCNTVSEDKADGSDVKPENSVAASESEIEEVTKTQDSDDDFIDFSAIQIATELEQSVKSMLEQNEIIDDSDIVQKAEVNEVYDNIMNVCSTTAQAIKKTISEVLSSRENVVITVDDSSNEFEASLSQKIADFENVVSGCFPELIKSCSESYNNSNEHSGLNRVSIVEIVEDSSEEAKPNVEHDNDKVSESMQKTNDEAFDVPSLDVSANNEIIESSEINSGEVIAATNDKIQPVQEKSVLPNQSGNMQKEAPKSISAEDKLSKKQLKSYGNKKKGEKTVDQVLKSLANYPNTEEKLQALCKKHVEALEEYRLLEPRLKQLERQVITQQREKEQLQAEHNRMILAKSRLESLCRELQRQSKAMKEENLLRIREEEEKRKEVANKFQSTLNDISALMQENSKKNIHLREENAELAKKLKSLVDHYEMWEKHMEKVVQQKDLETQLAKAKYAKINLMMKQETEKFLREKQSLLENMSELQRKCTQLTSNELQLRTELGDYTSKYEEFQSVLNKSSQVFASFKTDMEATSKKIKKLEKETNVYKQKWESSNNALLGMIEDKQKHDKELLDAQQRNALLEKLCRVLQAERKELRNQLNAATSTSVDQNVPTQVEEENVAQT